MLNDFTRTCTALADAKQAVVRETTALAAVDACRRAYAKAVIPASDMVLTIRGRSFKPGSSNSRDDAETLRACGIGRRGAGGGAAMTTEIRVESLADFEHRVAAEQARAAQAVVEAEAAAAAQAAAAAKAASDAEAAAKAKASRANVASAQTGAQSGHQTHTFFFSAKTNKNSDGAAAPLAPPGASGRWLFHRAVTAGAEAGADEAKERTSEVRPSNLNPGPPVAESSQSRTTYV